MNRYIGQSGGVLNAELLSLWTAMLHLPTTWIHSPTGKFIKSHCSKVSVELILHSPSSLRSMNEAEISNLSFGLSGDLLHPETTGDPA